MKGNDPIGDTSIFHQKNMIMGGSCFFWFPKAMEFQPFKAARAAGLRLEESMLQGKGSAKGKGDKGDKGDARDRSRSRDFD